MSQHVKHARWDATAHKSVPTGDRGPKQTTPKHNKKNRWPYDASHPTRKDPRS